MPHPKADRYGQQLFTGVKMPDLSQPSSRAGTKVARCLMATVMGVSVAASIGAPSFAQDLPAPTPTAQDMYVACYLLSRRTDVPQGADGKPELFSMSYCGVAALGAIANIEGRRDRQYHYCLPSSSQARSDPATVMAHGYLDWFERRAPNLADAPAQANNGMQAFYFAMTEQFPCDEQ